MKRILMMLVAGLMAVGMAERPASASTFDLGTLPGGTTTKFVANFGSGISDFDDTINFSLSGLQTTLTGSITDINSIFGQPADSENFTLDLFSTLDTTTSLGQFVDASGTFLAFSYLNLAAGDYFFKVSGTTGPNGNAYQYQFFVNEVPLPPALLLFATALGGMALFGRKRKAQA